MLFDYTAERADELSIKMGEILEVVSKNVHDQEGWWEVHSMCVYMRVGSLSVCVLDYEGRWLLLVYTLASFSPHLLPSGSQRRQNRTDS